MLGRVSFSGALSQAGANIRIRISTLLHRRLIKSFSYVRSGELHVGRLSWRGDYLFETKILIHEVTWEAQT